MQVINHFYVGNMSVQRAENPSLKGFKLVLTKRNRIELRRKDEDHNKDHLDITVLESFDQVKPLYQGGGGSQQRDDPLREAEERSRFEKSQFVQKETLRAFKEVKQHEFRLISMYRPQTLAENFDAMLKEVTDLERTKEVKVDRGRLLSEDKRERQQYI